MIVQRLRFNGYLSLVYRIIAHSITNYCAPGPTLVLGSIYSYIWYLRHFLRAVGGVSDAHAII